MRNLRRDPPHFAVTLFTNYINLYVGTELDVLAAPPLDA